MNGTQLSVTDGAPVARSVSDNVDEYLFGDACVETLDRTPTTVNFDASTLAEARCAAAWWRCGRWRWMTSI